MKTAFRVDASIKIGTGHLMRCLTLADEILKNGGETLFICRNQSGFDGEIVTGRGHELHLLPDSFEKAVQNETIRKHLAHANWLPCSQNEDAEASLQVCKSAGMIDWLVVDHYALDHRWHSKLRTFAENILVIDDLADRRHDCDLILDQNYCPDMLSRYTGLIPFDCESFLGPKYALLRPEFLRERRRLPHKAGAAKRIFVFMGGADPENETMRILEAFDLIDQPDLLMDVVVGGSNPNKKEVVTKAGKMPQVKCHQGVNNMAALMVRSDLAIGAAGTTTWERCCLGLPSLLVVLAGNQRKIAQGIEQFQAGRYLGDGGEITVYEYAEAIKKAILSPGELSKYSENAVKLVDGQGTQRLLKRMSVGKVHLRNAKKSDCGLLWRWANDPQVRNSAFDSNVISWEDHVHWFKNKLQNPETFLFIAEDGSRKPIGQIRFDFKNSIISTNYWENLDFQGISLEYIFLKKGIQYIADCVAKPLFFNGKISGDKKFSVAVISDNKSWINDYIYMLVAGLIENGYNTKWVHSINELKDEDIVFYLGCGQMTPASELSMHTHNLVVHESDLPHGRGWSPLTWQILEGRNEIPITLFEAREKLDSGPVYLQRVMKFQGHELIQEIREKQAAFSIQLCLEFLRDYSRVVSQAREQEGEANYYPKRGPRDSRLDPDKSLREQINLFRVVDNKRYPAWFEINGKKYVLKIEKKADDAYE